MPIPIGRFLTEAERAQRFLVKVQHQSNGCHYWTGVLFKSGYGVCVWRKKKMRAHRVAYLLFKGAIPEGKHVLHKCDTPRCVNPDHLFLGDAKINSDDMRAKGREVKEHGEDRYNSKLTESKVVQIRSLFQKGFSIAKLAKLYQVNTGTISNIILRKRWKHV